MDRGVRQIAVAGAQLTLYFVATWFLAPVVSGGDHDVSGHRGRRAREPDGVSAAEAALGALTTGAFGTYVGTIFGTT